MSSFRELLEIAGILAYREVDRLGRQHWRDPFSGRYILEPLEPKKFYFCFVKGFMTRRGQNRYNHWEETSVDVWLEFVVSEEDLGKVPSDREIISLIEETINGMGEPVCYILGMKQVKHQWGVEKEKTEKTVTWPYGKLTIYRMPDYDMMDKKERLSVG